MIVKVCGLTDKMITEQLVKGGNVHLLGFNFYKKSPRYIEPEIVEVPQGYPAKRVGVFVDEPVELVKAKVEYLSLNYVQLHSLEDQKYLNECLKFCKVIKAVGIETKEDIKAAEKFEGCSYLLFDKKSTAHGGTGQKFNWNLLHDYQGETPFFLAGGIGPEDVESILALEHPKFAGIDINSRFEISPGIKDVALIEQFLKKLEI